MNSFNYAMADLTSKHEKLLAEMDKVNEVLWNADICHDIDIDDDYIVATINWGDWKHDHLRADYLLNNIGYTCIDTVVTDSDGSDCYSAKHFYYKPLDKQN